jgi:phosphoglycerate kinase
MKNQDTYQRLPLLQNAEIMDKVVLVRVDHNVVKNGKILDPYRIDATLGTLYTIAERGGRAILMTHVGRPRDKKTGRITVDDATSVQPIVDYLEHKLFTKFVIPEFLIHPEWGIREIDTLIDRYIEKLRHRQIGGIYLPNIRWFEGEEASDSKREQLGHQLAGLADIFVNDAFGSWQNHVSTCEVAKYLPGFAGPLMQKELSNLKRILDPERPLIAVIAGSKLDTKIGTLKEIYKKVDNLILGGVIYNAFLCAKYNVRVMGVSETDIHSAKELVAEDNESKKIIEPNFLIESETNKGRIEGKYRTISVKDFEAGNSYGYLLDVAPESFNAPEVLEAINSARTIFVNAVMGLTPHFFEGSRQLNLTIDNNREAYKLYGGGDTLQEFRNLNPGLYLDAIDNPRYYFFTGGGAVLKVIEEDSPYGLDPVKALMKD